jgi:hypothetical protein
LANRFDVEIDNKNPDYLIFGDENFGNTNLNFNKKDVVKIFYTGENRRPENYDCHYAISFDHNFNSWHYRLPLFVIYMWSLDQIHKTPFNYYHILNNFPPMEKTGFASFVVGNPNCKERNEFFEKLNAIKKVDSGGKVFNNINASLDGEEAKINFLAERKFNICFESMSYPGYVTEKILHAFYAKTIPIYWGSTTVDSDFNPRAFINAHDFKDFDSVIDHVMRIDSNEDLYQSMIAEPAFSSNIPRDYVLLSNFLNWFESIVYNRIDARE